MSLQSALDFLAGPGSQAHARDQTDFVGQTVEMGELRLRVRRVLAEGEAAAAGRAATAGDEAGRGSGTSVREAWGQAGPWRPCRRARATPGPGGGWPGGRDLHAAGGWSLQAGRGAVG